MCPIRDIDKEDEEDSVKQENQQAMESSFASVNDYIAALQFQKIGCNFGESDWNDTINIIHDELDSVWCDLTPYNSSCPSSSNGYKIKIHKFIPKSNIINERIGKFLCVKFREFLSNYTECIIRITVTRPKDKVNSEQYNSKSQEETYFEQYITKNQDLDIQQFKDALTNIREKKPCEWIETSSTGIYIPENVVLYLNRVSEDVFKSIGLIFSNKNKLTYQIYKVKSSEGSPITCPSQFYHNIQGNNRDYIKSCFTERMSWYDQPNIFMDIKAIRDNINHFGYRLDLAFLMPYLFECAKYMMDNGFLIRDGVLYTDMVSHPQAYSTMNSDEIAEITMEESIATAFMLNCIKLVEPNAYTIAEKYVKESLSTACQFGIRQLNVGARWEEWREAKTDKVNLQLDEWFAKYFSNGNIQNAVEYTPMDYYLALGITK